MIAGISGLLLFESRWHWYHGNRLGRRARAWKTRRAGAGGKTGTRGGSQTSGGPVPVPADDRYAVRRRKHARAPTTSEPQIVLLTKIVQTRKLPLAAAGEHDRENRGLGEPAVAGLRREEFGQSGKGTGRMGAAYIMNRSSSSAQEAVG